MTVIPSATATAELRATLAPLSDSDILEQFASTIPPVRDDERLARAFAGYEAVPERTAGSTEAVLNRGTRQTFTVLDVVHNTYSEIEADLLAVGDHTYFWFETGPFAKTPDEAELGPFVTAFDDVYDQVRYYFGSEDTPGIDGDPRLHILHVSPQTMCGVTADGDGLCGTSGFVSSADFLPAALNPHSNEREIFVMNNQRFGDDNYLGVLAHEFRHLIEANYDPAGTDWEKEGSAVLAMALAGMPETGIGRANDFVANPDQQLNSWTDMGTAPYYGQGYLFNQYIFDRFGETFYRAFATNPLPGLVAIDNLAEQFGLETDGDDLWLDWLAALVLHSDPAAPATYRLDVSGLDTVSPLPVAEVPQELRGEVHQYAADYYTLPPQARTVTFSGDAQVPLLPGQGVDSGQSWVTQRANYSNPRLTRTLDLRDVPAATLTYDVFSDIEYGYDFAYVSVSTDGGETWSALAAPAMQGLRGEDDPSSSALAPRFYTGRDQQWRRETVDLTPYAGQEILLRFELVTDPILTYSGLALDNITVPEIGFMDEGAPDGWTAEGFLLAPALLPQRWNLLLVTFPGDEPLVERFPVGPDGQLNMTLPDQAFARPPILVIAANTPTVLQPAAYSLRIE